MYPIERYLGKLKSYVRNRSRPEGSIAEGYLAKECLIFCSRYLHDGVKKRSKNFTSRYEQVATHVESPIFPKMGYPLGKMRNGKKGNLLTLDSHSVDLAHRYVLFNCEDELLQKYIEEHDGELKNKSKDKHKRKWMLAQQHSQQFSDWFREKVESIENMDAGQVPDHIKWLSLGPCNVARRYTGYFINGQKFYNKERDAKCKTQNSGVTLVALASNFASTKDDNPVHGGITYYGTIKEIIDLNYWDSFSVVLFRCDWFRVENDQYGLTRVNFNKLFYTHDPFILASQAHQVFYVEDPIEQGIHYVMKKLPKEFFIFQENMEDMCFNEPNESVDDRVGAMLEDDDEATRWCREGVPHTMLQMHRNTLPSETNVGSHDNNSDSDDTRL